VKLERGKIAGIRTAGLAAGVAALLAGFSTAATAAPVSVTGPSAAAAQWRTLKTIDDGAFSSVVATGKTTGWAVSAPFAANAETTGWQRDGSTWKKVAFPGRPNDAWIAATSATDVWAFTDTYPDTGDDNTSQVLRWTGTKWSVVKAFAGAINGSSVIAGNDVWVFGTDGYWHYNGHVWSRVSKEVGEGASALSATDVWAFNGTSAEHWNGHQWTSTNLASLLPPKMKNGLNDPRVENILPLGPSNVYAFGSGGAQDYGGPSVILHYNGSRWSKVAWSSYVFDGAISDGGGGLWILAVTSDGGTPTDLLHYAAAKFTEVALPDSKERLRIEDISRIPGTSELLAGGFSFASEAAVLLQYS
jgi:hypothetical protein